ncbi:MAG: hypothetical protein IPJ52_11395 [Rhodocyclaceae bacterium]|nr:hypothetical protein [Rhodocyclaceae bacterium]MBK6553019.1 hypothetical protein [Rhodocyclaceae bacterium]MBK6676037.1 hypothetical protein [Rhodocyclaceae bacterium]MBK7814861.1 hypothetical protein [Rhodocyclaceae bacterium]MBK9311339.1 hypothetical protein [Rhodocyclaceae bacterium]
MRKNPPRTEICSAFGFASPNAAEDYLRALARKGVIILEPGSARGNSMVDAGILDGDLLVSPRLVRLRSKQRTSMIKLAPRPWAPSSFRERGLICSRSGRSLDAQPAASLVPHSPIRAGTAN